MSKASLIAGILIALAPMASATAQETEKVVTPEVWCDRNIPLPDENGIYSMRILGWQFSPGDYDIQIKRPDSSVEWLPVGTDNEGNLLEGYAIEYVVPEFIGGIYEVQIYPWNDGTAPLAVTEFYHNHFEL